MASVIRGYEYDIFISYRQNDNRSGWITEFVEALKLELATTMKEPVSVYFDFNEQDGLLENHNVDLSLGEKLKCLIFIPVISHTYCDRESYAWQHEFLAFVKKADEEKPGRDIRLLNGNIASRILPVKIHNLDKDDTALLGAQLGGSLRSIDFIYREAGVNRPLKADDNVKENLNRTQYNNQINKTANAVKEIIDGLKKYYSSGSLIPANDIISVNQTKEFKRSAPKVPKIIWPVLAILLVLLGYFLISRQAGKSTATLDRSIAVLPLINLSSDPGQEYFSEGLTQEILNHLFMIGGLRILSGTSSMRYKDSKLPVRQIAGELGVAFVLEGNVSVSGSNIRMIVRLISGKDESLVWSEDYKRTTTVVDLLDIQSDVAQKIADKLKVMLNPDVKKRIEARPTENTEAYLLFLQALVGQGQDESARQLLEKAITLDPGFADAYATLAFFSLIQGNDLYGKLTRTQVLEKTEPLIKKALELDENSVMAHSYKASVDLWYKWDFKSVGNEFAIVNRLNPSASDSYIEFVQYLLVIGNFDEAMKISEAFSDSHDITGHKYVTRALACCYAGQKDLALQTVDTYLKIFQVDKFLLYNSMRIYVSLEKYDEVIGLYEKNLGDKPYKELSDSFLGYLGIAFFKTGNIEKANGFLSELSSRSLNPGIGSSNYFAAAVYAAMGKNDKAIESMQKAFSRHESEMVWMKVDPLFQSLRGEPEYENLVQKMKYE
jgi:TolB-like protein/lipoprotein NlpI